MIVTRQRLLLDIFTFANAFCECASVNFGLTSLLCLATSHKLKSENITQRISFSSAFLFQIKSCQSLLMIVTQRFSKFPVKWN